MSLDLTGLGASWYAGNLHKWVCAPKGAAFLSTRADHIDETVPTVISHAWNTPAPGDASRYQGLFDWTGTDDFTSWLVVPEVLACVGSLEAGGWPALMKRNHELALAAREVVSKVLDVGPAAPDEMVGSMFGVPLPDSMEDDTGGLLSPLNQVLLDDGFETLVGYWPQWPAQVLRLSAHHYNTLVEYEDLASHLTRIVV